MKRHSDLSDFAEALIKGSGTSSPLLLGVFLCGVLAVTLLGNWAYDLALNPLQIAPLSHALVWGGILLCVGIGYWLWRRFLKGLEIDARVTEQSTVEPHRGLVWLLSPGNIDPLLFAMRQHQPRLRHVWVIITDEPAIQNTLSSLREAVAREDWSVAVEVVPIEAPDLACTFRAVEAIYERHVPDAGLAPGEVIADITGGLKPMTGGMTLACYLHGWPLEYLAAARDHRGELRADGERILISVEIDTSLIHRAEDEG